MNELQRLLYSQQWLFFLKWMAPIVFVSLVTRFSGTKVVVTKFSQILLICSEAINIVFFFFWRHHSYFQTLAPLDKLLWQAANPECTIGVKQSNHHISHNASRQIKELQMQHYWSKNRLQVAQSATEMGFTAHCDGLGPIVFQKIHTMIIFMYFC